MIEFETFIRGFGPFFAVFTGLNLAYAGSEYVRKEINERILQLSSIYDSHFKHRTNQLMARMSIIFNDPIYQQNGKKKEIAALDKEIRKKYESLKKVEQRRRNFDEKLRSMFLIASLSSITFLLIGGYEPLSRPGVVYATLMLLAGLNLIYYAVIFGLNISKKNTDKAVTPFQAFMIFLLSALFAFIFGHIFHSFQPNHVIKKIAVTMAILASSLPYLIYFYRAWLHVKFFEKRYQRMYDDHNGKLRKYEEAVSILLD